MGRLADLAAAGHPAQGGPHEHGPQPGAAGAVPGPAGAGRGAGPAPAVPLHRAARKNRPARRRGRRLPPQLADAPKRGFPVPLADWLRQEKYYALVKAKLTGPAAERFLTRVRSAPCWTPTVRENQRYDEALGVLLLY